jgi:PKD repeat protein
VVQVLDDKGTPFAAVPVTFTVTAGGGSLVSVDSATDADGLAGATLVLGTTPGLNTVEVTAAEITASVIFEATGEIWNIPPYAIVDAPQEGIVGEELYFDGSSSFDFDGEIVSYEWDFGDATPIESGGSGMIVSHAYYTSGIYVVTLTVVDDYGDEGSCTAEVVIKTPSEATGDLIVYIDDLNLPEGLENSLVTSLQSAIDALNSGNYGAAEGKLNSFINNVTAQAGKKLSMDEAEYLTYIAGLIISAIETQYPIQASSIQASSIKKKK